MTEPIIHVDKISKKYRIGIAEKQAAGWMQGLAHVVKSPFAYLRDTLRPPTDEETLWALRDVSFDVAKGEVLGIIGHNGAGKSTLLKILSRLTDPTDGRAVLHGRVGSLLEVGTGFHPELTGRENVYMSGTILGMKRREIDRKLEEIVAFAEIGRFLDTPVKHYSSGMTVRLGFAVAAHLEPEILIVDEVLSVGDASFQKKCLGKMGDVAQEGRTVLFVSHSMPTMLRLCQRGVLMRNGQVLRDGDMQDVVAKYLEDVIGMRQQLAWGDLETAPGSDVVKLIGASLADIEGNPVSTNSIDQPLVVRLRYHVLKPEVSFRCVCHVHAEGTIAFQTMERREEARGQAGVYESAFVIPGNLLSEGDYTFTISFFSSRMTKVRHLFLSEVMGLHIYDPINGNSARGDYAERYLGVVRPMLDWERTYLGESALPLPRLVTSKQPVAV